MTENQLNNITNFTIVFVFLGLYDQSVDYIEEKWTQIIDPNNEIKLDTSKNDLTLRKIEQYYSFKFNDMSDQFIAKFALILEIKDLYTPSKFTLQSILDIFNSFIDTKLINNENTEYSIHENLRYAKKKWLNNRINNRVYNLELLTD